MGKSGRTKNSTRKPRDAEQILHHWCDLFYGGIPGEFVQAAITVYKSNLDRGVLMKAIESKQGKLLRSMETVGDEVAKFIGSEFGVAFTRDLKTLRPFVQSPPVPLALRRYDLPTLLCDLPVLLKAYRGLLAHSTVGRVSLFPISSDPRQVSMRALVWLYLAVLPLSKTKYDATANIAAVLGGTRKKLEDRIRQFEDDHKGEYHAIGKCLRQGLYPEEKGLALLCLIGVSRPD